MKFTLQKEWWRLCTTSWFGCVKKSYRRKTIVVAAHASVRSLVCCMKAGELWRRAGDPLQNGFSPGSKSKPRRPAVREWIRTRSYLTDSRRLTSFKIWASDSTCILYKQACSHQMSKDFHSALCRPVSGARARGRLCSALFCHSRIFQMCQCGVGYYPSKF